MSMTMESYLATQKRIRVLEQEGRFQEHINPIDEDSIRPTTPEYPFVKKPLGLRVRYALERFFIVKPYSFYQNRFVMRTQIEGLENLMLDGGGVITCNHVCIWDCLVVREAVRRLHKQKLYITAAYFNNRRGFLGEMMRACNMMPLGRDARTMKAWMRGVNNALGRGDFVLFYPEQAMWYLYEKKRPYMDGAFHFAARAGVPVIPTCITFTKDGTLDSEGVERRQFHYHILAPIYPKHELTCKENEEWLKEETERVVAKVMEENY